MLLLFLHLFYILPQEKVLQDPIEPDIWLPLYLSHENKMEMTGEKLSFTFSSNTWTEKDCY